MEQPEKRDAEKIQERMLALERENKYLRSLLDQAGISYRLGDALDAKEAYDPDQGARIKEEEITRDKANRFFGMFWGRTDVYSKRSVKKNSGESGYYPQCVNFWKDNCPRKKGTRIKCMECPQRSFRKLDISTIMEHLEGKAVDGTDVVGIYPLLADETCRLLVFDFDNHEGDAERHDFANVDETWREELEVMRQICRENDIDCLVERSRTGRGPPVDLFSEARVRFHSQSLWKCPFGARRAVREPEIIQVL